MRGASGGYVFHFSVMLVAGAMTLASALARAQSCESFFQPVVTESFDGVPISSNEDVPSIRSFQNRWKLHTEFLDGLRAMLRWAPRAELLAAAEGLLQQKSYRRRRAEDQLQTLFLIAQLHVRAKSATESVARELFENTARQFISGDSQLRIDRKDLLASWREEMTTINPGVLFDVSKPLGRNDLQYVALTQSLAALAHEVSHALSVPRVTGRIDYLVEEYRANQVGFIAQNERWPSKAESATSLLEVLFNPWRLEGYEMLSEVFLRRWKTEPYRRLFQSLSLDIERVALELRLFRTRDFVARRTPVPEVEITKMRAIIQERLIAAEARLVPAPKYGWDGYERNAKKPARGKE